MLKGVRRAIVIDVEEETKIFLEWNNTCSSALKVSSFEIEFTYLDFKVYTLTYKLTTITPSYSTSNYTVYQNLEPYLKQADLTLIEGIYKIVFRLTYQILTEPVSTHELSMPLYIKFSGNLLGSVIGVTATAGVAVTALTIVGGFREASTVVETTKLINTAVNPNTLLNLDSLPNGLSATQPAQAQWVKVGDLPKETVKRMYETAAKQWGGKTCPKCIGKWPIKATFCGKCGITLEEAKKIFSETVVPLTEKAKTPIYKTAGGIGVKVLARSLGIDTMMANCVLKTMLDSGLAKANVSSRFVINKFIINGSKIVVSAIIFLQISGLKVLGINYLILSIVLGATISFVVGKIVGRTLKYV
jgi:ribosomal protein L40E